MTRAPSLGLQDTLASAILQLDTIDQIRINIPQKSSYTMTLTPEEQEGSDQLTTSIVLEDYDIYRKGNNTFLSVKPAIENTINITSLPEVLRRLVANQYSNPIYELYQAKAVTPSSEQNLLPQGNYTCHILDNNDYPSTYLYLSIPFGKNPPDHADSLTLLADGGDNTIAIDIDIQGKDEKNHYYSSRDLKDRRLRNITKYVVYADSGSKKLGRLQISKPEVILNYPIRIPLTICFSQNDNVLLELSNNAYFATMHPSDENGRLRLNLSFNNNVLDVTQFIAKSQLSLSVKVSQGKTGNAEIYGSRNYTLHINLGEKESRSSVISLHTTTDGAQYMEWDVYRTRLNTLFARQLIERANNGIDAVLSPET